MFNSDSELCKATDRIFYASLAVVTTATALFGWFVYTV